MEMMTVTTDNNNNNNDINNKNDTNASWSAPSQMHEPPPSLSHSVILGGAACLRPDGAPEQRSEP